MTCSGGEGKIYERKGESEINWFGIRCGVITLSRVCIKVFAGQ